MYGQPYPKINSLWKRDPLAKNTVIPGEFSCEEFRFLEHMPWRWTEKVDGTNIRLHWNGETTTIGGRTDRAQIPADLREALKPIADRVGEHFEDLSEVTLYGEGYGPKIQKGGGLYRDTPGFILFDVRVGRWWLKDADLYEIAGKLGIDVVPLYDDFASIWEIWDEVCGGSLVSYWEKVGTRIEGLVGRPAVELHDRTGQRIITKVKVQDWIDYTNYYQEGAA